MGQISELSSEIKRQHFKRTKVAAAPASDHAMASLYQVPLEIPMVAQRLKSSIAISKIQYQAGSTVPDIERLCLLRSKSV